MSEDVIVQHRDDYVRRRMSYEFAVIGPEHEADLLEGLCEGIVRANQIQIRAEPEAYPCCLGCGKYKYVEPESCQFFDWRGSRASRTIDRNCQHVFGAYPLDKRRRGTCIDLACMLCAIYREKGDDLKAQVIIEHQFGPVVGHDDEGAPLRERLDGNYHAMVRKGDGTIVDPTHKVEAAQQTGQACGC